MGRVIVSADGRTRLIVLIERTPLTITARYFRNARGGFCGVLATSSMPTNGTKQCGQGGRSGDVLGGRIHDTGYHLSH
jgi:hypothetical protein